jgi:hypothetical protein
MGRGVARRMLWRALATAAVLALVVPAAVSSAADRPATRTFSSGVAADGAAALPAGWTFEHPRPGVYRLVGSSGALVRLDVVRWEAVADVTIAPEGAAVGEVRFTREGVPVDTAFSIDAAYRP